LKFPYLEVINYLSNGYESKYHGLQTTLTQRAWRGFSFVAGYSWAHTIDQASFNRGQNPQNSYDPAGEYGSSDNDIRHRFTFSMTYYIPGRDGFGQMLKGWQLTSIVTLQTRLPWNVVDGYQSGNDVSGSGEFSDRWNFFGNPQDFQPSPTGIPFFLTGTPTVPNDPAYAINNPACTAHASTDVLQYAGCYQDGNPVMTPPEFGFFGTMRRNIFRGPGYHNWDFSVTKMWTFHERFSVQLLGEFFNILNHPNSPTRMAWADS